MASANVVNTSVVPIESTLRPFYDDYDESKNFLRLIFRPGYAVQARELTQIGTLAQVQTERLGRHIFQNGSIVIGGQLSYDTATSINLAYQYAGTDVNVDNFIGREVVFASGNNEVRAQVVSGENSTDTDPPTILVKYLSGREFGPDSTIRVPGANTFANIASSNVTANGLVASISDGIFFINGFFVRNGRQTITVSKYSTEANLKIGLEYSDAIIDEQSDASLLDPAQEATNYDAPGAARYKMDLQLAKRTLDSDDLSKFIELSRLQEGVQTKSVRVPIYSEIEETLARRTYDESGNYTVRPFRIEVKDDTSNTANIVVKLDPGKAYVFGYEYETISPDILTVPRTRDSETAALYDIATAFGNYVTVDNIKGFVDITTMPVMNLHCVPTQSIARSNNNAYISTKIGTTRVRSIKYNSAANTANGLTHRHDWYIFDTRLSSITGNANASGHTSNTVVLNQPYISANNNAYNRATIRLTNGPGAGDQKTIVSYVGSTKTATVDSDWSETLTGATQFSIEFSAKEIESIDSSSANASISILSKDDASSSGNTVISEQSFDSLVFPFPHRYIRDSLSINNYQYKKVFSGVAFTSNTATISADAGEAFVGTGGLSDSIKLDHYQVVVTNPGTSGLTNGQVLSMTDAGRSISVVGQDATFTVNVPSGAFTASILASCEINTGTKTNPKTKTLVSANTAFISGAASNGSFISANGSNATLHLGHGQVIISNPNRRPSVADSLYISDIVRVNAIFDLGGSTVTPGAALDSYTDVSNRYTLDNGQRDTHYDHGAIILKTGVASPKGPLVVCVDYYNHSQGSADSFAGYFSVDSYPNSSTTEGYAVIPWYTTEDGVPLRLSDAVDFRPKRQNASNTTPGYTLEGIRIPSPNEEYTVTYDHYLGRRDLVVLSKDRTFKHIKGISATQPTYPDVPDDAMLLYKLDLPPYVAYASNVNVTYIENKRYTMRDIGKIEQRVQNLEYYQLISILEKSAADITIKDNNGLERTKYGIIADTFTGHQIGDVVNPDYRCSMDFVNGGLRPFFKQEGIALNFSGGDSNHTRHGSTVTLSYNEADFIVQNTASKTENVQPFLIAKFVGDMQLYPDNDIWQDTNQLPDVVVNLTGANDAWQSLASELNSEVFGTEWGAWETHWTGKSSKTTTSDPDVYFKDGFTVSETTTKTKTTKTGYQERTGTQTQINFDTIQESMGDRVVDVSIIPYIRPREVVFVGKNLRPNRTVWYYFDDQAIDQYVYRPNEIVISNSSKFIDSYGKYETLKIGSNVASLVLSNQNPANSSQRVLQYYNANGNFRVGDTVTGVSSGNTATIIEVNHYSGNANAGTTTTVTLKPEASNVNNWYVGNTIAIIAGLARGETRNITSYNGATRVATVNSAFSVSPATNSIYSIHKPTSVDGPFVTNKDGMVAGVLYLPSDENVKFRTGERVFRVIDNGINDLDNVTTRADGRYIAQGLMQTKEEQIASLTIPKIEVQAISETVPIKETTTKKKKKKTKTEYKDPLAQTFYVEESDYPNGIFLSSVGLFFKSKDESLPVWVEIRPVVNGFPDSITIVPYSRKSLLPEEVNISNNPSAVNEATMTKFIFDNPVYLAPNKEYALVVQTSSLNYEAYVSELGKKQLGTDQIISEQPYLGTLFKSQNASTWTPYQLEDLMFVLKKCVFTTTPATVYFDNERPTTNIAVDWMNVQVNNMLLSNTNMQFAFKATDAESETLDAAYTAFNPNSNYRNSARKIILDKDSTSFNVRCILSTSNPDISPWVDTTRYNIIAIENIINNANLSNTNIVLTNDGENYNSAANITMTITSNDATSTANAYVGTVANGNITSIIVDAGGFNYVGAANVSFSGGDPAVPASAVISTELDSKGGPILSKYITRKVILNEGFDAGDLRVYLTVNKPIGTNIVVYLKIRNSNDPTKFENRPYIKMVQATPTNRYSSSEDEYIEYEFRPSLETNTIKYNNGSTTFDTFNEFAVKIGLLSTSTITVPVVKDFRAIALPSGD